MATPGKNGPSKSEILIENEFRRVCKRGTSYLALEQLLEFQTKSTTIPVELNHLGVLWALDRYVNYKPCLRCGVFLCVLCVQGDNWSLCITPSFNYYSTAEIAMEKLEFMISLHLRNFALAVVERRCTNRIKRPCS